MRESLKERAFEEHPLGGGGAIPSGACSLVYVYNMKDWNVHYNEMWSRKPSQHMSSGNFKYLRQRQGVLS